MGNKTFYWDGLKGLLKAVRHIILGQGFMHHTLGARGLHAAHPDGRPKAGKMSRLHEANKVTSGSNRHFQVKI